MRLWSIHPKYMDCIGLIALWREGLLAKAVLYGKTKGYKNHPQLIRFKKAKDSKAAINSYLYFVLKEAEKRCYCFDKNKIGAVKRLKMPLTKGQLEYEFRHLKKKLRKREPEEAKKLDNVKKIDAHPIFTVVNGGIEDWEKQK